jgi:HEAT repeat protein
VTIATLLALFYSRSRQAELLVEGEPVDVWVRQLASDTWRDEAKRALIAARLPVVPHLARAFEKADSIPQRAQNRLRQFNDATAKMVNAPFPWEKVRMDLAEIMGTICSNYRFKGGADDPAPKEVTIAVDCLTRALQQTNGELREWCAQELWRIGPNAQSAVPALLDALQSGQLRETKVFGALGNIGPGPYTNEVLQALGKGLRASDRTVKLAAIEALSGMTEHAAAAVPALADLLDDADDQIANAALRTLARIGHLPRELKPKFERLLELPDDSRRAAAAVALLRIEPGHAPAIAMVRSCVETNQPANLRSSTVYLLAGIGGDAKIFENDLATLSHDGDLNVATFARDALKELRPSTPAENKTK